MLENARFLGEDEVVGKLYGTLAFFPAVKLLSMGDNPTVKVELYEVNCLGTIAKLHNYEGYRPNDPSGSLFIPRPATTINNVKCTVYEANFPVDETLLVKDGDWMKYATQ